MSNLHELRELILSVDTTYTIDKHTTTAFILQEYYLERLVNAFSQYLEQEILKARIDETRLNLQAQEIHKEGYQDWNYKREDDLRSRLTTNKSKE